MSPILYKDSFLKDPSNNANINIKNKKLEIIKNTVKYHKTPNQIYNSTFTDILPFIDNSNFNIDNFLRNNLIYVILFLFYI